MTVACEDIWLFERRSLSSFYHQISVFQAVYKTIEGTKFRHFYPCFELPLLQQFYFSSLLIFSWQNQLFAISYHMTKKKAKENANFFGVSERHCRPAIVSSLRQDLVRIFYWKVIASLMSQNLPPKLSAFLLFPGQPSYATWFQLSLPSS